LALPHGDLPRALLVEDGIHFRCHELAMINWPEMFRYAEDWANGFWTGAASASLMVMVGAAFVALVRAL
jgi:hypothetical protein